MVSPVTRRALLAGVAGSTLGLSACAGTSGGALTTPTAPSGIPENTGPATGTIEFWSSHPGSSTATEAKIISAFEAANPGVKVNLVDAGKNYEEVAQKFTAALAAGELPDVFVVSDVTWFNAALDNQLASVDDLARAIRLDVSDYIDALYNDYKLSGHHYALPYARSTPLFFYNKELWDKAGLEDRGPKDWQELKEWAAKLKAVVPAAPGVIGMADGANYLDWVFQNLLWDFDGGYSTEWKATFTEPETLAGLAFFQQLVKDGFVAVSKDPTADFASGKVACALMSTGSLGDVGKKATFPVGTAFLPGKDNCPTGGAGVAIPARLTDARKVNAMKFAAFLTNTESTIAFTQATGYMPVRKSALMDEGERSWLKERPNFQRAVDQLPHTRSQDYARVLVPGGGTKIGAALDQVIAGKDSKSVMAALQTEIQGIIDAQITPRLPQGDQPS